MNFEDSTKTSASKMEDIALKKSRSRDKIKIAVDENTRVINAMMSNCKSMIDTIPQIDVNVAGLAALMHSLSSSSKKLTPAQRNRLLRSINNAMNAIGSLKKDLKSIAFDCSIQASALKFKNDGLKRDLDRRKI